MSTGLLLRISHIFFLSVALLLAPACFRQAAPKPLPGSAFNKHFPKDQAGYDVVFTQEKEGFSQAVLKKGGAEVATLSVADLTGNAEALAKYTGSTETIAGQPAAASGSQGTTILVSNRFQVQVRSKVDAFTADDRKAWLERFAVGDLKTLAPNP